jgi:hypothetical protein
MSQENVERIRIGKYHAVVPPGHADNPIWWRLAGPVTRRSRRVRAFFFDLPRSRVRTAFPVRYYRDIVRDMDAGNIKRHLRATDPEARVDLFGMETFRGREGAEEALGQWRQSFPDLQIQMFEFINPEGPSVLCIGPAVGEGAGAARR